MIVGRIAIVIFFIIAVAGSLAIILKGIKLDIIGMTIGLLTGISISIPLFFGLIVRPISRWAGVGAVIVGTIAAIFASDLTIFGPLEIIGFLKLPFGARVFFIAIVTLIVFLLSRPMGRLGRNKLASIATSAVVVVGMWFFSVFCNANELISWDILTGAALPPDDAGSPTPYITAMTIGSVAFGALFYIFSQVYSRDLDQPEPEADKFFELLKTPIDVKKEVGEEIQTATAYPFVGMIVLILAVLSLALLLFPDGRANPGVNIVLSSILIVVGLGIMRGGKELMRKIMEARANPEEQE